MTAGIVYYPNGMDFGGLYLKGSGGFLTRVAVNNYDDDVESSTGTVVSVGAGFSGNAINISADYNASPGESLNWTWFSIKAGIRIGPSDFFGSSK